MKSSTYKNKAKEIKEQREKLKDCPRNAKKIQALKAEEKRLKEKAKEKKAEEDKKTSTKTTSKTSTTIDSSRKTSKASTTTTSKNQQRANSLTEVVRDGMSRFNPYAKEEFDGMSKEQLKEELNYRVHEMMEMNATCVKEGLKTFSSEQQFINESIAEVCQEQNITIDQYNEFMKS